MSTRNFISMQHKYSRVVLLVDMDCFYCQVEEKLDPSLKGQPLAVVQYNAWRGGGIIAVNYAARAKGVTRHMRGDEAKAQCPDIQLVKVPNVREKADLGKYRDAGKEVANVLQRFTSLLERASVDEAYLDITEAVNKRLAGMNAGSFVLQPQGLTNTYVVGYQNIGDYVNMLSARMNNPLAGDDDEATFEFAHDANDLAAVRQSDVRLLIGASIAGEVRAAVKAETGYECSAGIAHNKILAKLACGMNKPNKQTVLPLVQISGLFDTLPVGKITGLGGKFGEELCERLSVRFLGQVLQFSEADLQKKFGEKNGSWIYLICRGIDLEAVTPRFYSKSIGCCKKFPGRSNITGLNTLKHWLLELAGEICVRLEKDVVENNRRAKQMVVSYVQELDGEEISSSRSAPLSGYDQELLAKSSLEVIQNNTKQFFRAGSAMVLNNPIKFLGISVGKFETIASGQNKLQEMFANQAAKNKRTQQPTTSADGLQNVISNTSDGIGKEAAAGSTVEKKKTFLENYLLDKKKTNAQDKALTLNKKPEKELTQGIDIIKANNVLKKEDADTTDDTVEQEPSKIVPAEQPLKKSFFLNAMKKQIEQSVNQPTVANDNETCVEEMKSESRQLHADDVDASSKSFFAKVFPLTKSTDNDIAIEKNSKQLNLTDNTLSECPIGHIGCLGTSHGFDADNAEVEQLKAELQMIETEDEYKNKAPDNINSTTQTTQISINEAPKRKFSEMTTSAHDQTAPKIAKCETADNCSATYHSSYAEFAIPELLPEYLQFTKCADCGANVPSDELSLQTHRDHHIALQLSQQQRDEYRAQLSNKSTSGKSPPIAASKKPKMSPANGTAKAKAKSVKSSIKKFLKPAEAATHSSVASVAADTENLSAEFVQCPDCHLPVKQAELAEHKDFHVAKELQRKLNLLKVRTVTVPKQSQASAKDSRLQRSFGTLNASQKNTKPITQFFSQPKC